MKFAEKTVEEFLFTPGKSFVIPEFQRPYSWQVGLALAVMTRWQN